MVAHAHGDALTSGAEASPFYFNASHWRAIDGLLNDDLGPLSELAQDFDDLSIGSYPFQRDGVFGAQIVIRGTDGARVSAAMSRLSEMFP